MGLGTCWKQGLRKKSEGFPAPDSRVTSSSSLRAHARTITHTSHMYTQCPDIPRNINTDTLHTGNGRHTPTGRETLCQLPAYLVEMSCCSAEAPLETSLCLRVWGWRGATLAVRKAGAPGRGDEGSGVGREHSSCSDGTFTVGTMPATGKRSQFLSPGLSFMGLV